MIVKIIKQCLQLMAYFIVSVLAIDLLALYYLGGWIEPIDIIRIAELVCLYGFACFGIVLSIISIKNLFRD